MTIEIATPKVTVLAVTAFDTLAAIGASGDLWEIDDADGGQALVEFAGRACYQSWAKPNPATATNKGYIGHILDVGHGSVLEHGNVTFYIEGVSRSFTHELVRHRAGFAYSQLSQRYVDSKDVRLVVPVEMRDSERMVARLKSNMETALEDYEVLFAEMMVQFAAIEKFTGEAIPNTERRKRARQAARAVLPNATETKIVVTANYRAWRHFLTMRAAQPADHEIREVAMLVWDELSRLAPNVVQDFEAIDLPDGTRAVQRKAD